MRFKEQTEDARNVRKIQLHVVPLWFDPLVWALLLSSAGQPAKRPWGLFSPDESFNICAAARKGEMTDLNQNKCAR